ncbi:MAG: YidC/Oxa1 family insertase periplasmic-domain containing protein [Kiritimatiellae bacterium]|nr:YidC/Oxa1 family insertase periplasmic-domain containing protein [Kiritimatiellia bacterium]
MNKTEKLISLLLGAVLVWYLFSESNRAKREAANRPQPPQSVSTNAAAVPPAGGTAAVAEKAAVAAEAAAKEPPVEMHDTFISISNADEVVTFAANERGASVKSVTLLGYARGAGAVSAENPPVELDFGESGGRALELRGVAGPAEGEKAEFFADSPTSVVYRTSRMTRRFSLAGGYVIAMEETFAATGGAHTVGIGCMGMGSSKNDLLSVDSMALDAGKGKPGVIHHGDDDSPLKPYLVGGLAGGCSGAKNAAGMPRSVKVGYPGAQTWLAAKNRFFVVALASCDQLNGGFSAVIDRDTAKSAYAPERLSAAVEFGELPRRRSAVFYAGPKKQHLLWNLGMKDVMEFGMWRWLCYPLVWVLNLFNDLIPNYGVAIILLTILVRIMFWPLTRKSTEGMKKMQEIQPLMKELQKKFKDNPQRLQQETWALYKEKKVNPLSSCLPMLIQIPVFIALFNVLRSAVELRYAPFLWIGDLSEPEALFADWFPFGGLNLLPILMAVTTALQSAFTPTSGDAKQQRMMMIFMPAMMLVMFYSFPSALSLYWFLSNIFSIVQMWLIRREAAKKQNAASPEIIEPVQTRQMRRHR